MSQFSSMIQALALAVQTLADGGGPFWEADAAKKPGADDPDATGSEQKRTPVAQDVPPATGE